METKTSSEDLRILATIPSQGRWESQTGQCAADMAAHFGESSYEGEKTLQVIGIKGTLPEVRHLCVSEALSRNVTHHLWIDSDMVFPPDSLHRLLNHNLPVVGVNYVTKTLPPQPVAYVDSDDYVGPLWTNHDSTGLEPVAHTGMGLMLVDVRVYDVLEFPMFQFDPIAPQNVRFRGEDVWFCNRLADKNLKVFVDQDLSKEIQHIGPMAFTHAMAERSEDLLQKERRKNWATTVPGSTKEMPPSELNNALREVMKETKDFSDPRLEGAKTKRSPHA